jgi:hypothetical protein
MKTKKPVRRRMKRTSKEYLEAALFSQLRLAKNLNLLSPLLMPKVTT